MRDSAPRARPFDASTPVGLQEVQPADFPTQRASTVPIPDENRSIERPQSTSKVVTKNTNNRHQIACNAEPPSTAPESSAYALLELMQSVQQAAQTSANERVRARDVPAEANAEASAAKEPATKKRKPTHTVRKEEITVLTDEITLLEKRLAFLRGQSIANPAARNGARTGIDLHQDPEHPHIPNSLLREAIHEQQLSLASARSLVSQFFTSDFALPAHTYIHLTTTPKDRLRTLLATKPQQLRIARRYVLERSRHLNLTKPHVVNEQFMTERGDACNIRFVLAQFPGTLSVREVFDVATFFTSNFQMSYTDGAGRITIRENDDEEWEDASLSQHRLTISVGNGSLVELNQAGFSHYDEDEGYGIVTSTFVDRDDLHPYRPHERIRQDMTGILMVTKEKEIVVMRRLGYVRVHHNDRFKLRDSLLLGLSEGLSSWGDAIANHVRQRFGITM